MDFLEMKQELGRLYEDFFQNMGIDPHSGRVEGTNYRFTGMPFVGRNYATAPIKLMYVALDVGKDECVESDTYHSFKDREDIFPDGSLDFNAHIAGMYASALYMLKDVMGWQDAWEKLWPYRDEHKTAKAIWRCHEILPQDLMSYICYDNRYRFVTVGRNARTGSMDRIYLNPECEGKMLLDEIQVLNPDYVVFQGTSGLWNCHLDELKDKYKVIITYHPSCWQRGADKLQYIAEHFLPFADTK